jgi:hypothetical protein
MASGHLIADLKLALDRDKHFDHLDDAGWKLVASPELFNLIFEISFDQI